MLTKIFYHILGLLVAFCLLFAVLITVTETLLYRVDGYFAKEYQKYAVTAVSYTHLTLPTNSRV